MRPWPPNVRASSRACRIVQVRAAAGSRWRRRLATNRVTPCGFRARDDPARLASLAQIALADWRLRRARATGDVRFCDEARQALAGAARPGTAPDVLSGLGLATVSRDPSHAGAVADGWPASAALSSYALGYVDTVQAMAPLPQYLAAVYGGVFWPTPTAPALNGATPESLVDRFAPAYPDWEPDALYAVLSADR